MKPKKLIAADVSDTSIEQSKNRLKLHNKKIDILLLDPELHQIPLEDNSVDSIHSSGVLHHMINPINTLKEFRRIIKPNGTCQIMVYNYESIWVHLYVAHELMIDDNSIKSRIRNPFKMAQKPSSLSEAFRSSTDGKNCPVSRFYKPSDFLHLLK